MIKELDEVQQCLIDKNGDTVGVIGVRPPNNRELMDKLNEVIRAINGFESALVTMTNK